MKSNRLSSLTITQAQTGLRDKKFSAKELTQLCLDQIKKFDPLIHAYVSLNKQALNQAENADINLPLGGIPIAIKDNFLVQDQKTTASSKLLDNYIAHYDATVVKKLKLAGAIIIGKTNMDAWAHGSSTETSDFGPTRNPWNSKFLPGGSSGGSAAAVAGDMCIAAIGSETAGSIRQPSAWCGVTGFKPTYGRVSRYGVISMASSTDSPGPITKTVEDAAILTQIISGSDEYDATSSLESTPAYQQLLEQNVTFTIGVPKQYLKVLDPQTKKLTQDALNILEKLGHKLIEIDLLDPQFSIGVYTILQRSEVSSNLARFDGLRYGHGREFFGDEAKRRIMLGTFALSSGYYDQYYAKAQKIRTLIIDDFNRAFSKVDLIINPPTPGPAMLLGATKNQPMFGEMQDVLVEPSSIAGLCGISVPAGFISGLPVGFGFVAQKFCETKVFQLAHQFQSQTHWHENKPDLR